MGHNPYADSERLEATSGPTVKRHKSKQDHETPQEFVDAVETRFGHITWDLAAQAKNTKHPNYFDKKANSLAQEWHNIGGLLWLNPEYGTIEPWAKKCKEEADLGARITMLVPASIGTNWFAEHVYGHALVLGIRPRIIFVGEKMGYPKDMMLAVFGNSGAPWAPGFGVWRWK